MASTSVETLLKRRLYREYAKQDSEALKAFYAPLGLLDKVMALMPLEPLDHFDRERCDTVIDQNIWVLKDLYDVKARIRLRNTLKPSSPENERLKVALGDYLERRLQTVAEGVSLESYSGDTIKVDKDVLESMLFPPTHFDTFKHHFYQSYSLIPLRFLLLGILVISALIATPFYCVYLGGKKPFGARQQGEERQPSTNLLVVEKESQTRISTVRQSLLNSLKLPFTFLNISFKANDKGSEVGSDFLISPSMETTGHVEEPSSEEFNPDLLAAGPPPVPPKQKEERLLPALPGENKNELKITSKLLRRASTTKNEFDSPPLKKRREIKMVNLTDSEKSIDKRHNIVNYGSLSTFVTSSEKKLEAPSLPSRGTPPAASGGKKSRKRQTRSSSRFSRG